MVKTGVVNFFPTLIWCIINNNLLDYVYETDESWFIFAINYWAQNIISLLWKGMTFGEWSLFEYMKDMITTPFHLVNALFTSFYSKKRSWNFFFPTLIWCIIDNSLLDYVYEKRRRMVCICNKLLGQMWTCTYIQFTFVTAKYTHNIGKRVPNPKLDFHLHTWKTPCMVDEFLPSYVYYWLLSLNERRKGLLFDDLTIWDEKLEEKY